MAFHLRPRSKNQDKALNPEAAPEKKPLIINYDKDGNRIGDDGYVMTPTRKHMHTILNVFFVWGIICAVVCLACAVAAYAQGQQYGGFHGDFASFDLEVYGGNMFNGHSVGTLLRTEALIAIFTALFGPIASIQGFKWFYDHKSKSPFVTMMTVLALASLTYGIGLFVVVGLPDPISIINIVLIVVTIITMRQVAIERPTLSKAKVAKTVTKK